MLRRFSSVRMGKLTGELKSRSLRRSSSAKTKFSQENERLLDEFLAAREELKAQFENEKQEIVSNYERRNKYLRNLLEEYSEKIDMLKLNLEDERDENRVLKERLVDVGNNIEKVKKSLSQNGQTLKAAILLDSLKNNCDLKEVERKRLRSLSGRLVEGYRTDNKFLREDSNSDSEMSSMSKQFSSATTISKPSDFPNTKTDASAPVMPPNTFIGIHQTCREEFTRLLEEMKIQKKKHDEQLNNQKKKMQIMFEREKLQLEQCVFKQLNGRLEKEFKRRELLMNERDCLQTVLSKTIIEASIQHQTVTSNKLLPYDNNWTETNSDSGTEVCDNRSDEYNERNEKSTNTDQNFINEILSNTVIGDILKEQEKRLTSEFHTNVASLVSENEWLKKKVMSSGHFFEDLTTFQSNIKHKLISLKYLLNEDPYAC